jgi:REP element-mobilizing transposase RayT
LSEEVSETLQEVCLEISQRYEIHFLEIGFDEDHVHFLIQSVPILSPKKIVNIVKSLIACEIFRLQAEVKRFL